MENETKYSVSESTAKFIDCLNTLSSAYGEVCEAVGKLYGEDQEDKIIDREIYKPYSALRDAVKVLLLDSIEDNIATINSKKI